mmetsp:Transcript_140002/g.348923  ORF Transcript_140002/g.348923 Transcript_140002/m.348923 type:complete len:239 (+) Transcript_140002:766-1482(+)
MPCFVGNNGPLVSSAAAAVGTAAGLALLSIGKAKLATRRATLSRLTPCTRSISISCFFRNSSRSVFSLAVNSQRRRATSCATSGWQRFVKKASISTSVCASGGTAAAAAAAGVWLSSTTASTEVLACTSVMGKATLSAACCGKGFCCCCCCCCGCCGWCIFPALPSHSSGTGAADTWAAQGLSNSNPRASLPLDNWGKLRSGITVDCISWEGSTRAFGSARSGGTEVDRPAYDAGAPR